MLWTHQIEISLLHRNFSFFKKECAKASYSPHHTSSEKMQFAQEENKKARRVMSPPNDCINYSFMIPALCCTFGGIQFDLGATGALGRTHPFFNVVGEFQEIETGRKKSRIVIVQLDFCKKTKIILEFLAQDFDFQNSSLPLDMTNKRHTNKNTDSRSMREWAAEPL